MSSNLWCGGSGCSQDNPSTVRKCQDCGKRRCVTCDEPCNCDPALRCFCCGAQGSEEHGCPDCELVRVDVPGGQRPRCVTHDSEGEAVSWVSS